MLPLIYWENFTAMFKDNNWRIRYFTLISHARNRFLPEGYTENHHIIPKCMGGTNESINLVTLTAREHLIAHRMLTKAVKTQYRKKMLFALWAMAVLKNKYTGERIYLSSSAYAILREEISATRRGVPQTAEVRAKISAALMGKKIPLNIIKKRSETLAANIQSGKTIITRAKLTYERKILRRAKLVATLANKPIELSEASKLKSRMTRNNWTDVDRRAYSEKLSIANTGKKRTQEQCQNISNGLKASNYKHSVETRKLIGDTQRGKTRPLKMKFTIKTPDGQVIERLAKARDVCAELSIGVKYFYLSLQNKLPIQAGKSKGWQLLSKEYIN